MMKCALVLALAGCEIAGTPVGPAELGTFPYHPVVYELDLAILAYQLHGQSLIWPIDPYYEERAGGRGTSRGTFMALVRDWAQHRGEEQVAGRAGLDAYRGPGALAGLPDAPAHDPIIYDYARIHPWSPAIVNLLDGWTEYLTPDAITRRIRDVYVSARPIGGDGATVELAAVPPGRADADPDATDTLCAFEGGTGDRGEPGQAPAYSLMGFALARDTGGGAYDLHLAFRGSRSGSASRAALEALTSDEARGNPDWITDLGWDQVPVPDISTVGGVHLGFARSMQSILPGALQCLGKLAELRGGAPTSIYLSGHSLGGGLAQHFASAMLLGAGPPPALAAWPWTQLKLVTFSAPRAGDHAWAEALSGRALEAPYYDPGPLETLDADARVALDPGIVARLHDPARPAAFRVLISTDPITTTKVGGTGTHVGTTVYVNGTSVLDWLGVDTADDHEPANVRRYLTDALADDRTPPIAWRYRTLAELAPDRDAGEAGTPLELERLATAVRRYHAESGSYFDDAAFSRDLELMFAIERGAANRYPNVSSGMPAAPAK